MKMMLACSAIISRLVCPGVFCAYIADIVIYIVCSHSNGYHCTVNAPWCGFRWHEVMWVMTKYVLLPMKIQLQTHEDKHGLTCNGLVPDPFSISCYVMPI